MATVIWPQEHRKSKQLPRALWAEVAKSLVADGDNLIWRARDSGTSVPRGRGVCVGQGSTKNTRHGYPGEVKPEEGNS